MRMMYKNDEEQRRLRFEWRKMLEEGYDEDILEHERKDKVEKRDVITGPTSLTVLGTYYQQQMDKQKLADQRMAEHAQKVAEMIQAPSAKDLI